MNLGSDTVSQCRYEILDFVARDWPDCASLEMKTKNYLFGIVGYAVIALTTRADIIPSLSSTSPSGSDFTWSYSATLTQDENAVSGGSNGGDFFTIYDFSGFVPGSNAQPAGWTFTASLLGTTPPKVTPTDDPLLFNLTWHYTGGSGLPATLVGPMNLGLFSAESDTSGLRQGEFATEATKNVGPLAGTPVDNIGFIEVPVPEMSALLPMIAVCGFGAVGLARSFFRRQQR